MCFRFYTFFRYTSWCNRLFSSTESANNYYNDYECFTIVTSSKRSQHSGRGRSRPLLEPFIRARSFVCTELPKHFAVCTQASTQIPQDPSKVVSKARLFASTGVQTKHGNARTESPNIWSPELPAVPCCAALSSGRQLCWRPRGRSTQSPGERTSQSETALR